MKSSFWLAPLKYKWCNSECSITLTQIFTEDQQSSTRTEGQCFTFESPDLKKKGRFFQWNLHNSINLQLHIDREPSKQLNTHL